MKASRTTGVIAGAVAAVTAVVVAAAMLWPADGDKSAEDTIADTLLAGPTPATEAPASEPPVETVPPTTDDLAGVVAVPEASTLVASFAADIPQFDGPAGDEVGTVAATWHGRPSVLPVIEQQPGWLQVRLPQRPNGSTAWVRRVDVVLNTTPYHVVIDVAQTRLSVFRDGVEILDAPAGLGTPNAPTTVGNFFVAFKQDPPTSNRGWGPFVLVTSSHSETISDFESSGDAIAAIHGPLGAEEEIGDKGAFVSHGCIRLHLDDLAVLSELPAGTPIDVIDSSAMTAPGVNPQLFTPSGAMT